MKQHKIRKVTYPNNDIQYFIQRNDNDWVPFDIFNDNPDDYVNNLSHDDIHEMLPEHEVKIETTIHGMKITQEYKATDGVFIEQTGLNWVEFRTVS